MAEPRSRVSHSTEVYNEAMERLGRAQKALSALCALLAVAAGNSAIEAENLYALIEPIESEISLGVDCLEIKA